MPFLIIIAIGVVLVLLFNLWKALFSEDDLKGAYVHIADGSMQLKTWGTEDFFNLSSDALVLQGDEIKTSADSILIVEFFDGTLMRVAGGSHLLFQGVDGSGKVPHLEILFVDGKIWFNKLYKDSGDTEIVVVTDNVRVVSNVTSIFSVDNEFDEAVRVTHGEVMVEVMSGDDEKVVDEVKIGVSQQMIFTEQALAKFWEFQSPDLLEGINVEYMESDWYRWNISEDESPSVFSKTASADGQFVEVAPEIIEGVEGVEGVENGSGEGGDEVVALEDGGDEGDAVTNEPVVSSSLKRPTITSVSGLTDTNADGFFVVTSDMGVLLGSVSGAKDVVVNGYTLQQFKSGDETWKYSANAYGLMQPGENTYEVYAVDADGFKSEVLVVKVLFEPSAPVSQPDDASSSTEEVPVEGDVTTPPDWLTSA
jgi:hypothetical protein